MPEGRATGPNDKQRWKEKMAKDTIGIDVSKERLDIFWHSLGEALSLPRLRTH